ncbi:MAG: CRISPR-associated helicase Cas3' [Succinimonas sp.]|nr:CRISPR-associated helicase Cas3' [Succinimonas sp.]
MTELEQYWAKTSPRQSVITHGFVSGHVSQLLFDRYLAPGLKKLLEQELQLTPDDMREFLGYFVSLHDIGKIEFCFQSKDPQTRERLQKAPENANRIITNIDHIRHEKTSESCLRTIWTESGENRRFAGMLSEIIGAHHPGKTGNSSFFQNTDSVWLARQKSFEKLMREHFIGKESPVLPSGRITQKGPAGAILLAVLVISDWISSGIAFKDAETWINKPDAYDEINRIAEDFVVKSGLLPMDVTWPDTFCKLWPNISPEGKRPLQAETESLFRKSSKRYQLILLEAPMGEGKTEAGVFAALQMAKQWEKTGVYLALPTAATANQMVGRMRELLTLHNIGQQVKLLHSMSWLEHTENLVNAYPVTSDEYEILNWLTPIKRGLLGQYAVGTVDQAMLAATTVKYGMLRLLGLSNKVLIIDEIHSYDAFMSEIIKRLLEWCKALEIPVVMLSATLPPAKKQELFSPYTAEPLSRNYPLITAISDDGTVTEQAIQRTSHSMSAKVSLHPILNAPGKIAEAAIEMVSNGGCLCVLMNTVRDAQNVYSELKQRWKGDTLLFHAQFPAARRTEIERECILKFGKDKSRRPAQSILVATQVVEQSLDVDFDAIIAAVAPIDLLLQRLGRVHRHQNTQRPNELKEPTLKMLVPENGESYGSNAFVYPECLLKSSIRVLSKISEIRIPEDLALLVKDGYDASNVPDAELKEWMEKISKDENDAGATRAFLINPPEKQYNALNEDAIHDEDGRVSAMTRLGEPTVRIALLEEDCVEKLQPWLTVKNDIQTIEACHKNIAEMVMKQSLSISKRRFDYEMKGLCDIQGSKLLSGVRIIKTEKGIRKLPNGNMLCNDPELGFIIKEC